MNLAELALVAIAAAVPSPSPTPPDTAPEVMPERQAHSVPSTYELFAGCNGGIGVFIVEFTVTAAGTVKNPHTLRGPYCAAAEKRMLKAVSGWRYTPARKNGRAVSAHVTVTIAPGG